MKKFVILSLICVLLLPFIAFAQVKDPPKDPETTQTEGDKGAGTVSLNNPLGAGVTSVPQLIGKVIKAVVGIVGSLALLMFIYGGFTWMLSGGNSTAVERGKNILMWAAIGLVIIFMSYAIVNFIITKTAG